MTILVLLIALVFAVVVTPLVRQLALRINFVAVPKKDRAHSVVTPLMGGVAMYVALIGALLFVIVMVAIDPNMGARDSTFTYAEMFAVMLGGTFLAAVGLWDDRFELRSGLKLLLQAVPVAIIAYVTDIRISMPIPEILNYLFSICWFLYVINSYNYTDNMDGIAAMISLVAGTFFVVVTIINGQFLLAALSAAIAGTSFGFLRFNLFKPETKIFMGDVGSMFMGFLLAVVGLELTFPAESPWVTWPVPVLILGVPIFDTGMAFISRWRRGVSFLQGGTDHLSHRFNRLGFGRFGTPFAIGLLGSFSGCFALVVMHSSLENSLAAQVLVGAGALYMLYKLELTATYELITGQPRAVEGHPSPLAPLPQGERGEERTAEI